YVSALTGLEQMRNTTPHLAMAANGGSLINRVQRLLRASEGADRASTGWIAAIGMAVCLFAAGMARNGIAQRHELALIQPPSIVTADLAEPEPGLAPVPIPDPKRRAPRPVILAQASPSPAPQPEQKPSVTWLEDMQAAGYKDLDVDRLIQLK